MEYAHKDIIRNVEKALLYLLLYMLISAVVQMTFMVNVAGNESDKRQFLMNTFLMTTIISNFSVIIILATFFRLRKKRLLNEISAYKISAKLYIFPAICAFSFSAISSIITHENETMILLSAEYYSSKIAGSGIIVMASRYFS